MAFVTTRRRPQNEILSLFPIPLYTRSAIYYEEDLEEMGLEKSLDGYDSGDRETILEHARKLSRIQPELAFHFLMKLPGLLKAVSMEGLERWVGVVLDVYDSEGLNPAREFILNMEKSPEFKRYWGKGLPLRQVYGVLQSYLHALGRKNLSVEGGAFHYTDLLTIYLPERLFRFADKDLNFLLYKVMVAHKFAQIHLGVFFLRLERLRSLERSLKARYKRLPPENLRSDLSKFFHLFPAPELARDLFVFADTIRIEGWILENLPGLHRDMTVLKKGMAEKTASLDGRSPQGQVMGALAQWWMGGADGFPEGGPWSKTAAQASRRLLEIGPGTDAEALAERTAEVYRLLEAVPGPYESAEAIPYVGELRPEEAEIGRRKKRESTKLEFRRELAKLVKDLPDCEEVRIEVPAVKRGELRDQPPPRQEVPKELLIDGNPVPLPEAMQKTVEEIYEDLGAIPAPYLAATNEMSGHFYRPLCQMPEGTGYVLSENGEGIHALDEWDFRRQGYRKRWALLRETEAPEGGVDFARETLERHRGMIQRIRRQFERMRVDQTLLRRQKEGDGIDLDAAVEAFSDLRAGLNPSERLFVSLQRDRRDIATAFLIDLSGSTSGWINEMERTALLILCEAMEVLKDRFAIYGFSGRTRKRCELFRIKGFDEPYQDAVKGRIANLSPREYTRLGPPIRRLTEILSGTEAKTRLLVALSDGKPDDWDGYNGDYGIEDTRQALIEAKRAAVHPFCITIDKAEHRYLSRIFGAVNYVFIDNLSKLPVKIPEIYRKLTT